MSKLQRHPGRDANKLAPNFNSGFPITPRDAHPEGIE